MDDQKIIQLYQEGKSCEEIAGYFDCTSQCISKKLKKLGVQTRRVAGYYTPEELKEVRQTISQLRSQNLTYKEIAEIVGLSDTSVWHHLKHCE
ncbi:winged helix-turn-helix transcriptional regulator [Microcoleus sp. D2_18a_D3]|uniref:winged helix-turn-helix transcriptional regulator n=1 Tax=Microcoleus sp. D2_18a_D3 TaxID=3055330 RepID=UPI002FD46F0C